MSTDPTKETTEEDWLSVDDHKPAEPGWYPTVHCWDDEEGLFPGAHHWNGKGWRRDETGYIKPLILFWPRFVSLSRGGG
jgi:hypothetical protein